MRARSRQDLCLTCRTEVVADSVSYPCAIQGLNLELNEIWVSKKLIRRELLSFTAKDLNHYGIWVNLVLNRFKYF